MSDSRQDEPILTTDYVAATPALPDTEHLSNDPLSPNEANSSKTDPAVSNEVSLGATTAPLESGCARSSGQGVTGGPLGLLTQSFDNQSVQPGKGTLATNLAAGRDQDTPTVGEIEIEQSAAAVRSLGTKEIAGYTLLSVLGRGGMGVVYKAQQSGLNRVVALKMLLAGGHASEGQLRRFITEGRAVARLQHPNIVQIFDVGEQHGLHYFAMELVEGGSLEQLVQGTPQPAKAAAGLVETLARAIHHAHEHGIIHRDLKPANILLQRKTQAGETPALRSAGVPPAGPSAKEQPPLTDFEAKIADFGLAKFLDDEQGHTRTGTVAGTPSYMSPEQASGHTKETGPGTDIYSLGAILYKLLTGRPPFHSDTAIDTLNQVVSHEPVAPTRLQPKVPRDLETICLKCLTKEPHKRYRSARELAEDLRHFQEEEPIAARRTPYWERLWKWARRRPAVAALTALLAFVSLIGVSLVTIQWLRAEAARERAENEGRRAQQSAESEAMQRALAEKRRIEAQRVSAGLLRERGVSFCQQGEYGRGMLWLARALSHVPQEANDLDGSIRTLLSGWGRHLGRVKAFYPHPVDVMAAALSPDGLTVATGGLDGKLRLWDTATGRLRGDPLQGSPGQVHVVVFSPDGRLLLTGSSDGKVCIWRTADKALLWHEQAHKGRVQSAAFSSDGKLIATGGFDRTARVWEAATGKPYGQPLRHRGWVTGVAFMPDGSRLLSADREGIVRLWDVKTGKAVDKPWQLRHELWALALRADGKLAATGEVDNNIGYLRLWDTATGKPTAEKRWPVSLVVGGVARGFCNLTFSPDGDWLLSGSIDGTAQLWRTSDLKPVGEPLRHQKEQEITGVAFGSDGRTVLTGGRDGTARLWDISAMLPVCSPLRQQGHVRGIYFSADNSKLLTLSDDAGQIRDTATGRAIGPFLRHPSPVSCAAIGPEGRLAAIGDDKGTVRLWETGTGRPSGKDLSHPASVLFILFHPKGKMLVTGCRDNRVRFWDTGTGRLLGEPLAHDATLLDRASFSPDGVTLVTMAGNSARLWRVATRTVIGSPLRHQGLITAAAFSPDSKHLATASFDKTVRFWDTATAAAVDEPSPHREPEPLHDVAFSPSGETILTRAGKSVRLWMRRSWQPIAVLQHTSHVFVSCFSRDGRIVMTGGMDRTIRLWDAATGQPLGEPLPHAGNVFLAAIRPDSRLLASVQWDAAGDLVRLWPISPLMQGDAAAITRRLQVDTSLELDAGGAASWIPLPVWKQKFQDLSSVPLALK